MSGNPAPLTQGGVAADTHEINNVVDTITLTADSANIRCCPELEDETGQPVIDTVTLAPLLINDRQG